MKGLLCIILLLGLKGTFGDTKFENLRKEKELSPRFFKAQMLTTFTDYVFSTKTIFPQCVSSVITSVCAGKRRRRRMTDEIAVADSQGAEIDKSLLEGSLTESKKSSNPGSNRQGRFAFTVWTTTRTTSTATIKFTNTSTTLSLYYICTAGNVEFPSQFSCVTG